VPKVVLDTVVLVRSLINPFGRWGELVFEHGDRYDLVLSEPIVRELLEVLHRPELVRKYRTLPERDMHAMLDVLSRAQLVEVTHIPRVSRDPKDDAFLATARAAGADYLATEDDDLLVLHAYEGTKIVSAVDLLAILSAS
jgi:uncharacterized protein